LPIHFILADAVKQNHKFKNVTQNDMEEVIKYVLVQAPFKAWKKNGCYILLLLNCIIFYKLLLLIFQNVKGIKIII